MGLYINSLQNSEILTSYNFARNANFVFSEIVSIEEYEHIKNEYTEIIQQDEFTIFYINRNIQISEDDVIFTNTYFVKDLFKYLYKVKSLSNLKLITHQSDQVIGKKLFFKKPECIKDWYGININYYSKDLHPIPLGISNNWSPKNLKKNQYNKFEDHSNKINKAYVNFEVNTNYIHRKKILNRLKNSKFAKLENEKIGLDEYISNLNKFKYSVCPYGNGPDTHRLWESLYAGSVPIVFDHITYKAVENLPVIKIKDLKNINLEFIEKKFDEIKFTQYEKLSVNWWIDRINGNKLGIKKSFKEVISKDSLDKIKHNYKTKIKQQQKLKKLKTYNRKILNKIGF